MTDETKVRLDERIKKTIAYSQIVIFCCLFVFTITVGIAQNAQQLSAQQLHNDLSDQRLTKVETLLDERIKRMDDYEIRTIELEKEVMKLEYSTDNILKMLYWIGGAVGTIVLETAHRLLGPAIFRRLTNGSRSN